MGVPSVTNEGGIPVYHGRDVKITKKSRAVRSGIPSVGDGAWFEAMTFTLHHEEWTLGEYMNYGNEGQTYLATKTSTGVKYAVKFCRDQASREVEVLQTLPRSLVDHPNVLSYEFVVRDLDTSFWPARHIIVMEYIPNGELFDFIASPAPAAKGRPVSEGTSRRFLHDAIAGMAEFYGCGVVHRDLKPENLLLHGDGRIVIIDMGHAKQEASAALVDTSSDDDSSDEDGFVPKPLPLRPATTCNRYGTLDFNPPEAVTGKVYNCEASDVWSMGVVAFMLHAKLPPFCEGIASWRDVSGPDNETFWRHISASGFYPAFPSALRCFINTLWRDNPADRPSFSQLGAAVHGDEGTIAQFPGLAWLAEPTSPPGEFLAELRDALPAKTFEQPASRKW